MRLLAASGRREAALAHFARCAALLRSELGLAPMARTAAFAASLRATDSARDPAQPRAGAPPCPIDKPTAGAHEAPLPLLPDQLPFVGREAEVAALELAWRAGRCVLIEAEGGVGKSRLATDFAAAHGPHAVVRTRASDSAVPYAAFTRALRALAGPVPDLGGLPPWAQRELARLLPEWGWGEAPPPPLQSAAERNRFFEACTMAWLALTVDSFDAVILDDWHHADSASGDLLAYIAQRRREDVQPGARELVLYRPVTSATARDSLRRLADSSDALQLRLAPLADGAVLGLVQRLSGVAQPVRFATRLHRATHGNPFFLAETLRHLAEQQLLSSGPNGVWETPFDNDTQDYRELPVPRSVHEAVLARVQRLSPATQRVLEAACLAAEPFAPRLLAPACALSELDTVLAIEQAVEATLLREHEAGGYAFAHDLVQQALDHSLSVERRRLVHRRLALGAEAAGAGPALVATHHEASGDSARAVAHRIAAGDQAWALHALPEAIEHWQQALANGPTAVQAVLLHRHLMRAAFLSERQAMSLEHAHLLQALVAGAELQATQSDDDRVLALTDVARHLAGNERQPEAMALLDGLPATTSDLQRARVLAVRAEVQKELGHVDEAVASARSALALQAVQGRERASLLSTLALTLHQSGRFPEAVQVLREAADLSARLHDDIGAARARYQLGGTLVAIGDAMAESELLRAAAQAERVGALWIQRAALYSLCSLYADQTRPEQVLLAATRGWQLQPPLPAGGLRLMYRLAFVDAHHALGDLGAAWEHAAASLHEVAAVNEVYVHVAMVCTCLELLALLGETDRAAPLLRGLGADVLRQMPQHANDLWLARAQVALLLQDVDAAARALAQVSEPIGIGRVAAFSALLHAELALARGDAAGAAARLPDAQAPGMSDEYQLRRLALLLRTQQAAGGRQADTVATARAALQAGTVHASAALYLHAALLGLPDTGQAAAQDAAAHFARLCTSLQAHPAQQQTLRRRFAMLASPAAPSESPGAAVRG